MKKRISLLACVLAASVSFAGCSGKDASLEYDEVLLEEVSEAMIANFSQMDDENLQQFKDLSDYQLEYTVMQSGLPMKGEDFITMIDSWQAAEDECGAYLTHGEYVFEASNNEVTVTTEAEYEDRNATIMFKYDEDLRLESMDVSAKYSTGEILKKAGLNTVLGMGTVFAVLIFLSFIISLFKFIPDGNKKTKKVTKEVVNETAEQTVTEDVTDDLELVAVITAAIAASEGTSTDGFVVRSIKRRRSNNWN